MNTKLKITELDHLPEEKRTQLNNWIVDLGYRAAMEKVRTEWSFEITYNKIYRYYKRVLDKKVLDPENKLTMPEFIAYQNGEPARHHELTHLNVQKRACELSQLPDNSASMLVTLMRIANNPIQLQLNQRRLALAEETAALKREELDWKKSIRPSSQSQPKSKIFNQNSSIDSAPLGGLTVAQFMQSIPAKPIPSSIPNLTRNPNPPPSPLDESQTTTKASGVPDPSPRFNDSTIQPFNDSPNDLLKIAALEASILPRPIYQPFRIRRYTPPTEAQRLDHMRRRYLSFLKRQTQSSTPSDDSWRDECPCGNPIPCYHHDPLPESVNQMDPCSADFYEQLQKRGIPYIDPTPG